MFTFFPITFRPCTVYSIHIGCFRCTIMMDQMIVGSLTFWWCSLYFTGVCVQSSFLDGNFQLVMRLLERIVFFASFLNVLPFARRSTHFFQFHIAVLFCTKKFLPVCVLIWFSVSIQTYRYWTDIQILHTENIISQQCCSNSTILTNIISDNVKYKLKWMK